MARAVIAIAHAAALLLLIVITIIGAFVGYGLAQMFGGSKGAEAGMWIGAGAGFLIGVFWTAFFFTLSQIEQNTRETREMLERWASQRE